MTTVTGYPDSFKASDTRVEPATVVPTSAARHALDVVSNSFAQNIDSDAAETGSTIESIVAIGHSAEPGDVIRFTSGALSGRETIVAKSGSTANLIALAVTLPSAPANGDTFDVLRRTTPLVDSEGKIETAGGGTVAATLQALGSIVAASLTSSYQVLLTPGGDYKQLSLTNTCDEDLVVSLDAGTTNHVQLPKYTVRTFDYGALGLHITSAAIHVKYDTVAPTEGKVTAAVVR